MDSNERVFNALIALVYAGAAFLIATVGISTILSVSGEWGAIEFVTLGATVIQFGVFLFYAFLQVSGVNRNWN